MPPSGTLFTPIDDEENAAAHRLAKACLEKLLAEMASAPVAAEPAKSISQFCKSRGMSRAFFYALRRRGLAPKLDEIILPGEPGINRGRGLRLVRITAQSEREWDRRMQEMRASKSSELEAARAREQRQAAGKASAASIACARELAAASVSKQRRRSRRVT
jgi:hypothetical protein